MSRALLATSEGANLLTRVFDPERPSFSPEAARSQQALGALFGADGERASRDTREAATLAQAAEHLNQEMAEVLEFQEERRMGKPG